MACISCKEVWGKRRGSEGHWLSAPGQPHRIKVFRYAPVKLTSYEWGHLNATSCFPFLLLTTGLHVVLYKSCFTLIDGLHAASEEPCTLADGLIACSIDQQPCTLAGCLHVSSLIGLCLDRWLDRWLVCGDVYEPFTLAAGLHVV